jgi:hypothetical protein
MPLDHANAPDAPKNPATSSAAPQGPAPDPFSSALNGKKCFVVIPYGTKKDRGDKERDFEQVFDKLIKPTVTALGLECVRSKDSSAPGLIQKSMIDQLIDWELAIVDITTANENVFYELGIRHTARPIGTVIIRHEDTQPPFNISGMRALSYDIDDPAKLKSAQTSLRDAIITSLVDRSVDSLVHQVVPGLNVSRRARVLQHREHAVWKFPQAVQQAEPRLASKRIGMITGDLIYVDNVDVWVNPENTHMQMARIHDDSVSATIRYHGGKTNVRGNLETDIIGRELETKVCNGHIVEATTVLVTGVGKLRKPNGVRRIFHVAAQHGEPGKGYVTVRSIEDCVKSALEQADTINRWWRIPISLWLHQPLRSIIFPLFGTRGSGRDPQATTDALVQAALSYLSTWPDSRIDEIYFLAYTDRDKELCDTAFRRLKLAPV